MCTQRADDMLAEEARARTASTSSATTTAMAAADNAAPIRSPCCGRFRVLQQKAH
jgi:hypothetical protein